VPQQTVPQHGAPALDHAEVLRCLPLASLVFDASGVITFASDRGNRLLDPTGTESDHHRRLLGTNVLDLVHPDDQEFAMELLAFGSDLRGTVLGPIRLRYLTTSGKLRYTDFWAENHLGDPAVRGYVVVLTEEAAQHRFMEAVTAIAEHEPIESVLESVSLAIAANPMQSDGVVLRRLPSGEVRQAAGPELSPALTGALPGPWRACFDDGADVDVVTLDDADPDLAEAARSAGYAAVWCRAIPGDDDLALVCWRPCEGPPSPNQRVHLRQATRIVSMAVTQAAQRRQLETMAYTDPLTGLANRRLFYDRLQQAIHHAQRYGGKLGILFVDLDRFKIINDQHGHHVGDAVLTEVAKRLTSSIRSSDSVARLGGDEFVVLLDGVQGSRGIHRDCPQDRGSA